MEHSFDIEVAKELGVNCAVILKHIYFWVEKNKANDKNFFDGRYWTYNSVKAFEEIFPYLTNKQIRGALDRLSEHGLIMVGCYNEDPYDKTLWYSVTDKGNSILLSGQTDFPSGANRDDSEGKSYNNYNNNLPTESDNNRTTDNKPDNKKKISKRKVLPTPTVEEVEQYCIENNLRHIYPDDFINFYGSKGWMVGKSKMVNWHMSVAKWESDAKKYNRPENKALCRKIRDYKEQLEMQRFNEAYS